MSRRLLALIPALLAVTTGLVHGAPPSAAQDEEQDLAALIAGTPTGGTLRLDPGRYRGGVTIDRAITIEGAPGVVIDGHGQDTVVRVTATDVTLRALEIRGSGSNLAHEDSGVRVTAARFHAEDTDLVDILFGFYMVSAPQSVIRNSTVGSKDVPFTLRGDGIHVYQSPDTLVEGNQVSHSRDIIAFFSDRTIVRDNVVEDGRYGLHVMYSHDVTVTGNRMLRNSTALYVMYSNGLVARDNVLAFSDGPSGYGLAAKESDIPEVSANRLVGNRVGAFLDASPFNAGVTMTFTGNVFAYNIVGVLFQPSVRNTAFTSNAFIDNQEQVSATTGGSLAGNAWTIDGIGNYWSDYAGYDRAGDGIGDVPYRAERLYDALTDNHPELAFFAETPAAQALDAAARAFPTLRPAPKAVDDAPLVHAPTLPPLSGMHVGSSRSVLFGVSAILLLIAAALVQRGVRPLTEVRP